MAQRPLLDDETFYRIHYGSTDIPRDIPIRVRSVLVEQLGEHWRRICPHDKPDEINEDLDFAEIIYEIEEEFGTNIPLEAMRAMAGSFDSVVRYITSCRANSSVTTPKV